MDKDKIQREFSQLSSEDRDLTMFKVTNLTLSKTEFGNMVFMALNLKRKVTTELLTTYFPTILLLLITYTTVFFDKDLFGDVIAVNLTIMLVMTTIFTSKIEELPPTSDMKMIDIWLIFCLVVPFLEVILRTAIECVTCNCHICESEEPDMNKYKDEDMNKDKDNDQDKDKAGEEDKKKGADLVPGGSSSVWVLTGSKVAPQQVTNIKDRSQLFLLSQVLTKDQDKEKMARVEACRSQEKCANGTWKRAFEITG